MDRLCPVAEDGKAASPAPTLGDVLRAFLSSVASPLKLGARPLRVLRLLAACGLPELGANLYRCAHCHKPHFGPRSCGDRHCPRCLAAKSWHWLKEQLASLLPVTYYHCVVTLPQELHGLVRLNPVTFHDNLGQNYHDNVGTDFGDYRDNSGGLETELRMKSDSPNTDSKQSLLEFLFEFA